MTLCLESTVLPARANEPVTPEGLYNVEFTVTYRVIEDDDIAREVSVRLTALKDVYFTNFILVFETNATISSSRPPYGEDSHGNQAIVKVTEFTEGLARKISIRTTVSDIKLKQGEHYSLWVRSIYEPKGARRLGGYGFSEYLVFPKIEKTANEKIVFYLQIPHHERLTDSLNNPYTSIEFIRIDPSFDSSTFDSDFVTLSLRPSAELLGPERKFLFEVEYKYVINLTSLTWDVVKIVCGIVLGATVNWLRRKALPKKGRVLTQNKSKCLMPVSIGIARS